MRKIGIHDPWIGEADHRQVKEALDSNWISGGGEKTDQFERGLKEFFGAPAVSVVNGTGALLLALRVSGFRSGCHMLVSAYGFVATANAVRHLGGEPIFLGPESTGNPVITLRQLKYFFETEVDASLRFRRTGKKIHGLLYNEPYGFASEDLGAIAEFLSQRGLVLIEDASQAVGVSMDGKMLGSIGHIGVLSLNGNKTLTTGAGGVLLTSNSAWEAHARRLQNQSRSDDFDFFYDEAAHNLLLSNVLAGLGVSQLARLPEIIERKISIRKFYREFLGGRLLGAESIFPAWLNVAMASRPMPRANFRELAARLDRKGIRVRPAFPAVTANVMYRDSAHFFAEHSNDLFDRGLCLPSGPQLSQSEVETVCSELLREGKDLGFN